MSIEVKNRKLIIDGSETSIELSEDYIENFEIFNIIRIKSFERTDSNGKKFIAYKAVCDNKRYLDLSFTQDAGDPKISKDFAIANVKYNIDTNRMYPRVYVKEYDVVLPFSKEIPDTLKWVRSCD